MTELTDFFQNHLFTSSKLNRMDNIRPLLRSPFDMAEESNTILFKNKCYVKIMIKESISFECFKVYTRVYIFFMNLTK